MKRLLLLCLLTLLLCGCSVPSYTFVSYTDYTRYSSKGVYVSSLDNFDGYKYAVLGNIIIECGDSSYLVYNFNTENVDVVSAETRTHQEVLDLAVEQAIKVGANGIIAVDISYHPRQSSQSFWVVKGVAVKFDVLPPMIQQLPILDSVPEYTHEVYDGRKHDLNNEKTIDYLLYNDMPLRKYDSVGQEVVFDIDGMEYISKSAFIRKYGELEYYTLKKSYTQSKKKKKKSKE